MTVRTRFAPSPTGYLHIGGVRTALFNYLFAKKHGGQFILRIDDTDQQRNVQEALQPILDGFRWLGLQWDEGADVGGPHGPYYQSQKLERYQDAVRQLLAKGLAYWDYATNEETKAEMEAAEKDKRPKIYSRRWMAETDADRARFEAEGRTGSVKAKMPRDGVCHFRDHIRGDVEVAWAGEQDTVIQRSDGTVTYNLANVVDDFDMKITHVIRAEEHLSNTPRQIFMLEGLGYPRPEYAHVPFVAEPGSKNKLSKRKIAQYLKNADFKRIHEHGEAIYSPIVSLRIAATAKRIIDEWITSGGAFADVDAVLYKDTLTKLGQTLSQHYISTTGGVGDDGALLDVVKAMVADFGENLGLLDTYIHGTRILDKYGLKLPPGIYNPVLIDFYKQVGYLPDALLNYLVLLGWSLDDAREDFTLAQMVELFSLERVIKSPASFDVKKLLAVQERYMLKLSVDERVERVMPFLADARLEASRGTVIKIVEAAGPRLRVAGDILDYADFFTPDDVLPYDEKALDKHVRRPPGAEWIGELRNIVAMTAPFDHDTLKAKVDAFVAAKGVKPIPVTQTLRVALTGKEVGFGVYDTLAILGRDRALARIDRALTL